jgi:hypothetical protein
MRQPINFYDLEPTLSEVFAFVFACVVITLLTVGLFSFATGFLWSSHTLPAITKTLAWLVVVLP